VVIVDLDATIPPRGLDRYEIERELGEGGTGAVFLARDRETGEQVALKKLFRVDPKSVLRVKREFRSLADMNHPNLVRLYDLGRADDGWFLTMEYVPGPDLSSYVKSVHGASAPPPEELLLTTAEPKHWLWVFHELAQAVQALHRARMLHRDLKPSNVIVANGRVVVLDFGLVRALDRAALSDVTFDHVISGTPGYMAPEQAAGGSLSEATDWYAFGVMLYEALCGELPFDGNVLEILNAKLNHDAEPVSKRVDGVPEPLVKLCAALLSRDPAARPRAEQVIGTLAPLLSSTLRPRAGVDLPLQTVLPPSAAPLFGRSAELAALTRTFLQANQGQAVVVHVRGQSGAGKSALIDRFLEELDRTPRGPDERNTLVLRSRCYEREAMPFKALDGVIDALVTRLSRLDDFQIGRLLPSDIGALVQLFPAFERLPAVAHLLSGERPAADRLQDRKRADAALSDLFKRLANFETLVIAIDDLHWGDLDSASLLTGLLKQIADAPILLLFSYRGDEVDTSPCLRQLLANRPAEDDSHAFESVIALDSLSDADLRAICERHLGDQAETHAALIDQIVRDSQGSPFLASQLAALAAARLARGDMEVERLSIDALVTQMNELLPEGASELLAVLTVAARPLTPKLALAAAGVLGEGKALVHTLRSLHLIRTRDVAGGHLLEMYHDRVRERIHGTMSQERRERTYASLLDLLERSRETADPAWLHVLALGANRREPALRYALIAAERAFASLAFERAAELYCTCLELDEAAAANNSNLWTKLGNALACCCRGVAAAEAYQEAAKLAPPAEAIAWTRLAASHLLRSGRFEEGERIVGQVFAAMDVSIPDSDSALLAAIVWERLRLQMRGLDYREQPEQAVPARVLERIDTIDSLGLETQSYDPLRAALLQLRGMRLALETGEPKRVSRALGSAAILASVSGAVDSQERSEALLQRAEALTSKLGDPRERAAMLSSRAICAFMQGRTHDVLEPSYEAERIFRASSSADYYMRFAIVSARIGALYTLGDQWKFKAELSEVLEEARETDNRTALLQLTMNETVAEELDGQPERSIKRLEQQYRELPRGRFGIMHLLHMGAVMRVASATGEYAWAAEFSEPEWQRYRRSPVSRVPLLAFGIHTVRARFLLNRHVHERSTGSAAALIRSEVRGLRRLTLPWAPPFATRMQARAAVIAGDRAIAIESLRQNVRIWGETASRDEAARDQWALGRVLGDAEGAELMAAAEATLRTLGVLDPALDATYNFPELTSGR
jgi:serine/threonine protein kinase/tetratricopeptide (TPR) repeat protein